MSEASYRASVVRLDAPGRSNPLERVISTVGRVDLALADALHHGDDVRPYATARAPRGWDVYAFDDALTMALLTGDPEARLVARHTPESLLGDGGTRLVLRFETPCHFRVAGFEYQIPDPFHVFGNLLDRWKRLGWPELGEPDMRRVGVYPRDLRYGAWDIGHTRQRGFLGEVTFDLRGMDRDARDRENRATLWALARFGELRGVGKHTTYGMGRVVVVVG